MKADELRVELSQMAVEQEPFHADVRRVRGRVARSRVAMAAALAVILALPVGVALVRDDGNELVTAGPKRVSQRELMNRDVLVIGTSEQVRALTTRLDENDDVVAYSMLEPGLTTHYLILAGRLDCDSHGDGLVIDLTEGVGIDMVEPDAAGMAIYDWDPAWMPLESATPYDLEIFMRVDAPQEAIDAIAAALADDLRIDTFEHITKAEALAEFQLLFADEPNLLESTTADVLPESFRLDLVDPSAVDAVFESYTYRQGVAESVRRGLAGNPDLVSIERMTSAFLERGNGSAPVPAAELFMEVDASTAQIDAVQDALENDPDVASFEYLTKEDAYEEFKRIFAAEPDLVESTTADLLPSSFRLIAAPQADLGAFDDRYDSVAGVGNILVAAEAYCTD